MQSLEEFSAGNKEVEQTTRQFNTEGVIKDQLSVFEGNQ
jgi:hypothetical protein